MRLCGDYCESSATRAMLRQRTWNSRHLQRVLSLLVTLCVSAVVGCTRSLDSQDISDANTSIPAESPAPSYQDGEDLTAAAWVAQLRSALAVSGRSYSTTLESALRTIRPSGTFEDASSHTESTVPEKTTEVPKVRGDTGEPRVSVGLPPANPTDKQATSAVSASKSAHARVSDLRSGLGQELVALLNNATSGEVALARHQADIGTLLDIIRAYETQLGTGGELTTAWNVLSDGELETARAETRKVLVALDTEKVRYPESEVPAQLLNRLREVNGWLDGLEKELEQRTQKVQAPLREIRPDVTVAQARRDYGAIRAVDGPAASNHFVRKLQLELARRTHFSPDDAALSRMKQAVTGSQIEFRGRMARWAMVLVQERRAGIQPSDEPHSTGVKSETWGDDPDVVAAPSTKPPAGPEPPEEPPHGGPKGGPNPSSGPPLDGGPRGGASGPGSMGGNIDARPFEDPTSVSIRDKMKVSAQAKAGQRNGSSQVLRPTEDSHPVADPGIRPATAGHEATVSRSLGKEWKSGDSTAPRDAFGSASVALASKEPGLGGRDPLGAVSGYNDPLAPMPSPSRGGPSPRGPPPGSPAPASVATEVTRGLYGELDAFMHRDLPSLARARARVAVGSEWFRVALDLHEPKGNNVALQLQPVGALVDLREGYRAAEVRLMIEGETQPDNPVTLLELEDARQRIAACDAELLRRAPGELRHRVVGQLINAAGMNPVPSNLRAYGRAMSIRLAHLETVELQRLLDRPQIIPDRGLARAREHAADQALREEARSLRAAHEDAVAVRNDALIRGRGEAGAVVAREALALEQELTAAQEKLGREIRQRIAERPAGRSILEQALRELPAQRSGEPGKTVVPSAELFSRVERLEATLSSSLKERLPRVALLGELPAEGASVVSLTDDAPSRRPGFVLKPKHPGPTVSGALPGAPPDFSALFPEGTDWTRAYRDVVSDVERAPGGVIVDVKLPPELAARLQSARVDVRTGALSVKIAGKWRRVTPGVDASTARAALAFVLGACRSNPIRLT